MGRTPTVKNFDNVNLRDFRMPMFTVYKGALDFEPDDFIVRLFDLTKPTFYITVSKSLDDARATIPEGMIRMNRTENDEPHIVEVWL